MCGIVAVAGGDRPAAPEILAMLRRLEYRGYDSAGVATLAEGRIELTRCTGRLHRLEEALARKPHGGGVGIGHTRWATHGPPSVANAHPHVDPGGCFAIAHNGIIENHDELRKRLRQAGHRMASETDSEVIVHLLVEEHRQHPTATLGELARGVARQLEGAYAIAVVGRSFPGQVAGVRHRSPLVVGIGAAGEPILASSTHALDGRANSAIFLEDGDTVEIRAGEPVRILDRKGIEVVRELVPLEDSESAADRQGYAHFMHKEIHEQPDALQRTLDALLGGGSPVGESLGLDAPLLRRIHQVHLVACGTAHHAALVTAYAIEELARLPARAVLASEYRYASPIVDDRTLLVAVSQSGETEDTRAALEFARDAGARTVAITNTAQSQIQRMADGVLHTRAGPEIGVASTKCYTTQLLAGVLLAAHLAQVRETATAGTVERLLTEAWSLPDLCRRALRCEETAMRLAVRYQTVPSALYIGRRYNFPTALEGALKLKEISYIHAEGYGAGEMKHGPIALVEPSYPTVAIAPRGTVVHAKMISNIQEILARRGPVVAVATESDPEVLALVGDVLEIPPASAPWTPILAVIPCQLLAYHTALARGCDVDHPRNLAKSVTVE